MTATPQDGSRLTMTLGGALIAAAGLLPLPLLLGADLRSELLTVATIALATGSVVLAVDSSGGVVGPSPAARIALVVFGVIPLAFMLTSDAVARLIPIPIWTGSVWVEAVATVVVAIAVVRARVLRGPGRWAPCVVAVDAVLTATMSTVPLGDLQLVYAEWELGYVRLVALLAWGLAIVLHVWWPEIRHRAATVGEEWRRTTDIGAETPRDRVPQR